MKVSFYQVKELEKFLPKLLEKIYQQGKRVVVICQSREHVLMLDTLLWTQGRISFLPHGSFQSMPDLASEQPIWLTEGDDNPNNASVVIVLNEAIVQQPFEQMIDLSPHDSTNRLNEYKEATSRHYWKQRTDGTWYDSLVSPSS